ncbi:MAG TPA: ATP-binding protein [Williamsia sp.]
MGEVVDIDGTAVAPVSIRVRAERSQVPMVRAIAETLAVLADFSLDEVADIKLAVDEAATSIIVCAAPEADLVVGFSTDVREFRAVVQSWVPVSKSLSQTGFGWHVLQTLTDTVTVQEGAVENGGRVVAIELSK